MPQRLRTFDKPPQAEAKVHRHLAGEQSRQPTEIHQQAPIPGVLASVSTGQRDRFFRSIHPVLIQRSNPAAKVGALRYLEQTFGNRAVQRYLAQKVSPTSATISDSATQSTKGVRIGPGVTTGRNLSLAKESRSNAAVNSRPRLTELEGQLLEHPTPVKKVGATPAFMASAVPAARQELSPVIGSSAKAQPSGNNSMLRSADLQIASLSKAGERGPGVKLKRLAPRRPRRIRRKRLSEERRAINLTDDLAKAALTPSADPLQIQDKKGKFSLKVSREYNSRPLSNSPTPHGSVVKLDRTTVDFHPRAGDRVQRLSWSDLNPIEAAKKLAERAWGGIKSLGSSVWSTAKSLGSAAWNTAKSAGSSAWNAIKSTGSSVWNTVKNVGTNAWNTAKGLGSRAWNMVKDAGGRAWTWAKSKGSQVWNGAKSLGSQAWNWAKSFGSRVWNGAKSFGSRLWSTAKSWGSRAWTSVKNGVSKAWGSIKTLGGKVWETVKGAAGKAWDTAKTWGGKAWNLAKSIAGKLSLENLCKAVGWLVEKAYNAIAPLVKAAWTAVKKWGAKAWELAKQWGGKLWNGVKSLVGKIEDFAKKALDKAISTVKSLAGRAWDNAKQLGTKLLSGAKRLGTKAWDFAKRMGSKAWDGAKALAGKVWNLAKSWGGKAIDTAKRLGAAAWDKAKALGSKIYESAKNAAGKLLSIADKLTGGLASKVAGMAQKILDKASGLLSWVLNKARDLASRALETAKSWASKALDTAKAWGSKLWDAAKSAASKAWDTAKSWAGKAWDTAKSWAGKAWETAKIWGSKAIDTAKSWASKAWDTAKSWAGKAWDTAKSWAGQAWETAKSWAGKAWDTVKGWAGKVWDGVKWLGGKAWSFAKWVGGKALDLAKTLGLDKAWNYVKDWGAKALQKVKEATTALMKRLKGVIDVAKTVGEYLGKALLLTNPTTISLIAAETGCKILNCAMTKLMQKGESKEAEKYTDEATDLIPYVSTVKDTCGCLTGDNMVTGKKESTGVRVVRCVVAIADIAAIVAGFFSGGTASVGEQAAKGGIRAWLKRLFRIGGKELAEKGEKELAKQLAKMGEKELAEAFAKMGEKELKELAEQAARAGEKELAEKAERELAKRLQQEAKQTGEKILAEGPAPGGHTIHVKPGGLIEVCSEPPCANIGLVFREVLQQNPELAKTFQSIRSKAQRAEQLIASGDPKLVKEGEKLAQEAYGEARRLQTKLIETGIERGGIRYRPEPDLLGSARHGLEWSEKDALERALRTGNPQGKFGGFEDIHYAVEQAATLRPGNHGTFPLPAGNRSVVFMPNGSKVPATQVFVLVRRNGSVHAYPLP